MMSVTANWVRSDDGAALVEVLTGLMMAALLSSLGLGVIAQLGSLARIESEAAARLERAKLVHYHRTLLENAVPLALEIGENGQRVRSRVVEGRLEFFAIQATGIRSRGLGLVQVDCGLLEKTPSVLELTSGGVSRRNCGH